MRRGASPPRAARCPATPVKKRTRPEPKRLDPFDDRPVPRDIVLAGQRRDALRLHKAGKTYDEVGEELGLSELQAKKIIRDAVKLLAAELADNTVEEHKAVALAQLNDLYCVADREREIYCAETKEYRDSEGARGKIPAVDVLIDIQEHMHRLLGTKAKLLGLNAATKVEATADFLSVRDLYDASLEKTSCQSPPWYTYRRTMARRPEDLALIQLALGQWSTVEEAKPRFIAFCSMLTLMSKSGEEVQFNLNEIQLKYLDEMTQRDIILKPRQVGMTSFMLAWDIFCFLTVPGAAVVVMEILRCKATALSNEILRRTRPALQTPQGVGHQRRRRCRKRKDKISSIPRKRWAREAHCNGGGRVRLSLQTRGLAVLKIHTPALHRDRVLGPPRRDLERNQARHSAAVVRLEGRMGEHA